MEVTPSIAAARNQLLALVETHHFLAAEINFLTSSPMSRELLDTLKDMKPDVAPGLDGLSPVFYTNYWDIIGSDFTDFAQDAWISYYLSANTRMAAIVPVPKSLAINEVEDMRPISLSNTSYKVLAKILAGRLGLLLGRLILPQ